MGHRDRVKGSSGRVLQFTGPPAADPRTGGGIIPPPGIGLPMVVTDRQLSKGAEAGRELLPKLSHTPKAGSQVVG